MSVQDTKIKTKWDFPETSKTDRILTGHYINLIYTLPKGPLGFLSFLIYQAEDNNTFKYTTKLLRQYRKAVELAQERYIKKRLGISEPTVRKYLIYLIEQGLVSNVEDKWYLINPNLTFHKNVKPAKFKEWRKDQTVNNWLKQD